MQRWENTNRVSDTRRLATANEVAEYLQIPPKTLAEWRSNGTGPRYSKVGRYVRYTWPDVDAWLTSRAIGTGQV